MCVCVCVVACLNMHDMLDSWFFEYIDDMAQYQRTRASEEQRMNEY